MGRSVDYLSHAKAVTFIDNSNSCLVTCHYCGNTNVTALDEDNDEGHNHICNECDKTFEGYEPDPDPQFEWDCFTDSLYEVLQECCPSLNIMTGKERRWDGRETSLIADNVFCEIGLSEYCGLVSVSIRVNEHYEPDNKIGMAENWIKKTWPNVEKALNKRFTTLRKIATFSNGEGVYEKTVS